MTFNKDSIKHNIRNAIMDITEYLLGRYFKPDMTKDEKLEAWRKDGSIVVNTIFNDHFTKAQQETLSQIQFLTKSVEEYNYLNNWIFVHGLSNHKLPKLKLYKFIPKSLYPRIITKYIDKMPGYVVKKFNKEFDKFLNELGQYV